MVRAGRISKALVRAASRLPSSHRMNLRATSTIDAKNKMSILKNTTGRTRAKPDLGKTKMIAMVKPRPNSCWLNIGDGGTISIPTSRLLVRHFAPCAERSSSDFFSQNELPVRVREKVEVAKDCCARFVLIVDGEPLFDIPSLRKHQLFSNDHADHLGPEIVQWLPRVVCPGCVLDSQCQDGSATVYIYIPGTLLNYVLLLERVEARRCCATSRHVKDFRLTSQMNTESCFHSPETRCPRSRRGTECSR
jgi:hypothetical protein